MYLIHLTVYVTALTTNSNIMPIYESEKYIAISMLMSCAAMSVKVTSCCQCGKFDFKALRAHCPHAQHIVLPKAF